MVTAKINRTRLNYEIHGTGDISLVLVHGSWGSHQDWDLIVPRLADIFTVITYDRHGHNTTEQPVGTGSIDKDVDDLAELIESLGLAPVWVLGNSFGASITLRLAGKRPELLSGFIGHEPPLFSLLADNPIYKPMLKAVSEGLGAVVEQIASGDHRGAAKQFIETVALGPGAWEHLSNEFQQTFIQNAPTFLDEANDPEQLNFDLGWIHDFPKPALLTLGNESLPIFAPVVDILEAAIPGVEIFKFPGAGHLPHITNADSYVDKIIAFIRLQIINNGSLNNLQLPLDSFQSLWLRIS